MVVLLSAVHYMPTFSVNVRLGSVNVRLGKAAGLLLSRIK